MRTDLPHIQFDESLQLLAVCRRRGVSQATPSETAPHTHFDRLFSECCRTFSGWPFGTILRGGLEPDRKPECHWREPWWPEKANFPQYGVSGKVTGSGHAAGLFERLYRNGDFTGSS
jgi:hypothetical protein